MLAGIAIYALAGVVLFSAWYYACLYVSRRRANKILQWIENALVGEGHVTGLHWITASRFLINLKLLSTVFHGPSFVVELAPWEPMHLLYAWIHGKHEIITFQADLDFRPNFRLEVLNHSWYGRTRKRLNPQSGQSSWDFDQVGPFVFSTRDDWKNEITSMINALLATREQDVMSIAFQQVSPHFSATLPLAAFALNRAASSHLLAALRDLAMEASASRHG